MKKKYWQIGSLSAIKLMNRKNFVNFFNVVIKQGKYSVKKKLIDLRREKKKINLLFFFTRPLNG